MCAAASTDDAISGSGALSAVGQVALHVTSTEIARHFYGDVLGLAHLYTYGDLTFFDCGGTRLYLQAVPGDSWAAGTIVYFRVGAIHAAYERLVAAGVEFTQAPQMIHRHEDGAEEWMAFFTDPSGNALALMGRAGGEPDEATRTSPVRP